jgi:putative spermidine/putrescine transport system permease protein
VNACSHVRRERGWSATLLASLAVVAFLIMPLLALVLWSFAGSWFYPDVLPTQWSLAAWRAAFLGGAATRDAFLTSVGLAVAVAAVAMIAAVPAGLVLGRERFAGRRAVEIIILLPLVVPPFGLAMGLMLEYLLLTRVGIGLYHSWLGVLVGHAVIATPYATRLVQAGAEGLGRQAEDAARNLGASPLRAFWHVTLPGLVPSLALASFSAFLVSLSTYLLTIMLGGGLVQTLPLVLVTQLSNLSRPAAAVTATLLVLPGLAYLFIAERALRRRGARVEFPVG